MDSNKGVTVRKFVQRMFGPWYFSQFKICFKISSPSDDRLLRISDEKPMIGFWPNNRLNILNCGSVSWNSSIRAASIEFRRVSLNDYIHTLTINCFGSNAQKIIKKDYSPFGFPLANFVLKITNTVDTNCSTKNSRTPKSNQPHGQRRTSLSQASTTLSSDSRISFKISIPAGKLRNFIRHWFKIRYHHESTVFARASFRLRQLETYSE